MATITSPRSESPAIAIPQIRSPSLASANGTPSSSVRPSIDLPINGASSSGPQQNATGAPATSQRRNRAALRDYYNLKSKDSTVVREQGIHRTASIASNASDSTIVSSAPLPESSTLPAQLDDPSFDADSYVSEMLKTASLRDILRTEGALVSEIRNLDGERKALVYDNYSKLIKAVGTIAEMQQGMHKKEERDRFSVAALGARQKEQAPGLDGVEKLGDKFDGLFAVVKELGPGQGDDGKRLLEAREKRRQKETVKWALEAPSRLRHMIDQGRGDEAVREHQLVIDVLDKWTGVSGVDELRNRCAEVMDSVKDEADEPKPDDSG